MKCFHIKCSFRWLLVYLLMASDKAVYRRRQEREGSQCISNRISVRCLRAEYFLQPTQLTSIEANRDLRPRVERVTFSDLVLLKRATTCSPVERPAHAGIEKHLANVFPCLAGENCRVIITDLEFEKARIENKDFSAMVVAVGFVRLESISYAFY